MPAGAYRKCAAAHPIFFWGGIRHKGHNPVPKPCPLGTTSLSPRQCGLAPWRGLTHRAAPVFPTRWSLEHLELPDAAQFLTFHPANSASYRRSLCLQELHVTHITRTSLLCLMHNMSGRRVSLSPGTLQAALGWCIQKTPTDVTQPMIEHTATQPMIDHTATQPMIDHTAYD